MTKAEEIFNIKAEYNKWLKELTDDEKELILEMINEAFRQCNVSGRSELLKAFVDWWHGLSQEELAWYEGRYVEVFLSL